MEFKKRSDIIAQLVEHKCLESGESWVRIPPRRAHFSLKKGLGLLNCFHYYICPLICVLNGTCVRSKGRRLARMMKWQSQTTIAPVADVGSSTVTSSSEDYIVSKWRVILSSAVDKWITKNDWFSNTTMWLTYEQLNRECVRCLKCSDKLVTCCNYSSAFVEWSKNFRSSAFKDQMESDMHQWAMLLLRKASAKVFTNYSPIERVVNNIGSSTEEQLNKLLETVYMLCKENLSISKMSAICDGVDLGHSYMYARDLCCITLNTAQ